MECAAVFRNGKLIKPATKFLVLGTPLAQGDFIDAISKNPEYKVFHRSVVDFNNEALAGIQKYTF